jgi:hypothetical protein
MRLTLGGVWLAVVTLVAMAHAETLRVAAPVDNAQLTRAWTPTTVSPVGKHFEREISTAWGALPSGFRDDLRRNGWQVQLAEFVVDAAPNLAEQAPRGWPSGMSWRQSDAVHLPGERRLIVAEKRLTAAGTVVSASRTAGVLRHELGHAYDVAHGGRYGTLSASPAFLAAYQGDLAQFPATERDRLAYYLQAGPAGRQETFAEAVALALGGGSDDANAAEFAQRFPSVLKFAAHCIR